MLWTLGTFKSAASSVALNALRTEHSSVAICTVTKRTISYRLSPLTSCTEETSHEIDTGTRRSPVSCFGAYFTSSKAVRIVRTVETIGRWARYRQKVSRTTCARWTLSVVKKSFSLYTSSELYCSTQEQIATITGFKLEHIRVSTGENSISWHLNRHSSIRLGNESQACHIEDPVVRANINRAGCNGSIVTRADHL